MAKVGPLDGVRVVEMTSWMAAPGAGAALADMGADVIKVEPLTGDVARGINRKARVHPDSPDIDGSFTVDNRGKRSVAVAIDRPDGRRPRPPAGQPAPTSCCATCCRRARQRYGLDAESLFEVKPNLVHATLTGYGLNGPDASRPGYDVMAFFGRGGDHRAADDARPARPAARLGAGRPHHVAGDGRGDPRRAARRRAHRRGPGGRRQPDAHGDVDDGRRPVVGADRRAPADQAGARPAAGRDRHRVPLQRRPLPHPQHARATVVAAVLRDARPSGMGRRRALRTRRGHASTTWPRSPG